MKEKILDKQKKNSTNWAISIGTSLILIAIVLLIWFFLQGKTTVTGGWPEPTISHVLSCEAFNKEYPFFAHGYSRGSSQKINAIFKNDKLNTISLIHTLYYNTLKEITDSKNLNHTAMNQSFASAGLGADALGAKFSEATDSLQFSLYAESDQLNGVTAKYFMLDGVSANNYTEHLIQQNYEKEGFTCVISE